MERLPMKHTEPIARSIFNMHISGLKNFIVCCDDKTQEYKAGDTILLEEYQHTQKCKAEKTGNLLEQKVKYILRKSKGLKNGFLILGLE